MNQDNHLMMEALQLSRDTALTAIQNVIVNELKKRGFQLTKVSHANAETDGHAVVFMKKQTGPMHNMVEIGGMGEINGEHFQDGKQLKHMLDQLAATQEDAEETSPFRYDPMTHLADAAHQIHKILKSNSDDEARTEHLEKMAEIILGPQSEYASVSEYRRILSGVIELLQHHVSVDMN